MLSWAHTSAIWAVCLEQEVGSSCLLDINEREMKNEGVVGLNIKPMGLQNPTLVWSQY